jgi:four helix bundle protein
MKRFEALEVALELARALGPAIEQVRGHDRDTALQIRRAATSTASCLAEGSKRAGGDRLQLFRTAGGSAAEIRTQIQLAAAWKWLAEDDARPIAELADRVAAMAWRLTHPRC